MRRPSPALVISIIALVFAATGTGWAVTRLPRSSVGTAQLKNGAVVSSKVKDGSLLASDFAAGQLPAGATGATGARGPSDAWVATASSVPVAHTGTTVIESAALSAGSYTTNAMVGIADSGGSVSPGVVCSLSPTTYDTGFLSAGQTVPVTLVGAVTLTSAGTIGVTCHGKDSTAITATTATLVVTRVETLTSN